MLTFETYINILHVRSYDKTLDLTLNLVKVKFDITNASDIVANEQMAAS